MFSRDSRRRNKEAFLQKIGAHAKGDDERFLRKRPAALHAFREMVDEPLAAAGRNATAVDLVTKRRDCRLDRDSFATRKLDDRLDEANCKLDGLTGACEAEFDAFRGRVGAAVTRVLGALGGVECAWACGVAGPATAACEDVADRGSPALKTFSAATAVEIPRFVA
ncbi:hypothetical protein JL720_9350 [Aureococcus anophagefferens]|nr:hypothetical protein JL720_9350 [Aureococcus anophagefferens]